MLKFLSSSYWYKKTTTTTAAFSLTENSVELLNKWCAELQEAFSKSPADLLVSIQSEDTKESFQQALKDITRRNMALPTSS
jgi:hypothetical protein